MSEDAFEIVLVHLDGYARVKLRGELDYQAVRRHREGLEALAELRRNVVIDLAEVTFIDSGGLAALVAITCGHEGPVRLEGLSLMARQLITMSGLDEVFEMSD
jgi:anti-anti-sigma factor